MPMSGNRSSNNSLSNQTIFSQHRDESKAGEMKQEHSVQGCFACFGKKKVSLYYNYIPCSERYYTV